MVRAKPRRWSRMASFVCSFLLSIRCCSWASAIISAPLLSRSFVFSCIVFVSVSSIAFFSSSAFCISSCCCCEVLPLQLFLQLISISFLFLVTWRHYSPNCSITKPLICMAAAPCLRLVSLSTWLLSAICSD